MDTIVAISTPIGKSGIGVVRVSGKLSLVVAKTILGFVPIPRYARYVSFLDIKGLVIDKGIALYFSNPYSFTGEDILELHSHGNPIILNLLVDNIIQIPGIRLALPGEFTKRAFLNGKIDLTQAEAVLDLISANSIQAVRSSLNSLKGVFSTLINNLLKKLIKIRIYIEGIINFPDECFSEINYIKIQQDIDEILLNLENIQITAHKGRVLSEGIKVVITGKPNVGKSTLFNLLVGKDSSIVSAVSGTTRDVIRESLLIQGVSTQIVDTAGIHDSDNEIEILGIQRAIQEINNADKILFIIDVYEDSDINKNIENFFNAYKINVNDLRNKIIIIRNKIDIISGSVGKKFIDGYTVFSLSAKNKIGIDVLWKYLKNNIINSDTVVEEGIFLARKRHLEALDNVKKYCISGKSILTCIYNYKIGNIELLAEDLRLAQHYLSIITGDYTSDDLLGDIFSVFCVGK